MSKRECCYCKKSFDAEECRPYGPGGAHACFFCATKPENMGETDRQFKMVLSRAVESRTGSIIIGDPDGPQPGPRKIGESN